ncbi:hypothetical protein NHX12_023786 [Muraenolepis orangiensis]|uniref:C2H2-type domain-containing protein n=1 Tax=Muraenolepis orangiensis TaxID=630683 RepID=A0A9Q0EK78_9TELE|nr:hypothetical protein NHX12_023786 [Muraenolepis orangiensis]
MDQKDSSSPKDSESPKDRESPEDTKNQVAATTEQDETSAHVCGVCGRSFPLLSSLSQHMRRHTREKPYKCPYCEYRTAQKGSLKAHVRSHKLGLLGHSPGPEETEGASGHGEDIERTTDSHAEVADSSSEKEHGALEGKVKTKMPRNKAKREDADAAEEESSGSNGSANTPEEAVEGAELGPFSCSLCSQVFPQAVLLKAHMKKHRGSQDHGCRICGRRFRQAWFLQSHMRIHRAKAQLKSSSGGKQPATVNGVSQDPATMTNEECIYELCAGCGNFFYDRSSLQVHEKLHKQSNGRAQNQTHQQPDKPIDPELLASKEYFMKSLNLRCVRSEEPACEKEQAGRILELDPICSYQAWKVATKGRLAEVMEKGLGWEERLADAEVAYNREKGEYVALKQDKKRKQGDTPSAPLKKKKAGVSQEHTASNCGSGSTGGHHGQTDHTLFNGLGHAFYVALQQKKLKEVCQVSAKPNNSIRNQGQKDKKPLFCDHCDFHAVDAPSLRSHVCKQHPDLLLGSAIKHSAPKVLEDNHRQSGSKDSKYMDYLRSRSALLSQPYWSPFASLPGQEKTEVSEVARKRTTASNPTVDGANLINLSALPVADSHGAIDLACKPGGLVRHWCPYCSHTTNYPEVLWIHQRVAHRVDSGSSVAPRWAPCLGGFKGSKASSGQWRRTGPPPFLEGKDCPALPTPKTQRTQAPGTAAHGSSTTSSVTSTTTDTTTGTTTGTTTSSTTSSSSTTSTGRRSTGKTQQGNPSTVKPKSTTAVQSKESRSADRSPSSGRKTPLPPLKKKSSGGERSQRAEEHGRSESTAATTAQVTSSSSGSAYAAHSGPAYHPTGGPKHRGSRVSVLPQEGLGFMLARNHVRSPSSHHSSGVHTGHDMNLWALHGGRAYAEPPLYAQGKSEARPEDIDVLSLLKNYSPHDLAALYHHWGFVDPRIDPQAMLQINGGFVNEVRSTSEASRQVNSHTTPSSGSLQKGT